MNVFGQMSYIFLLGFPKIVKPEIYCSTVRGFHCHPFGEEDLY